MGIDLGNLFETVDTRSDHYLVFREYAGDEHIIAVIFGGKVVGWIVKNEADAGNCNTEQVPGAFMAYDIDRCIPTLLPTVRAFAMLLGKKWSGDRIDIMGI